MGELDQLRANGAVRSLLGSRAIIQSCHYQHHNSWFALGLARKGAVERLQDTPASLQVPLEAGARPHPAPRAAGGNPGRPSYNAALPVPERPRSTERHRGLGLQPAPGGTWTCPPAPCPAHLRPLPAGLLASTAALSSKPRNTMGAAGGIVQDPAGAETGAQPEQHGGDAATGDAPVHIPASLRWHPTCTEGNVAKGNIAATSPSCPPAPASPAMSPGSLTPWWGQAGRVAAGHVPTPR